MQSCHRPTTPAFSKGELSGDSCETCIAERQPLKANWTSSYSKSSSSSSSSLAKPEVLLRNARNHWHRLLLGLTRADNLSLPTCNPDAILARASHCRSGDLRLPPAMLSSGWLKNPEVWNPSPPTPDDVVTARVLVLVPNVLPTYPVYPAHVSPPPGCTARTPAVGLD